MKILSFDPGGTTGYAGYEDRVGICMEGQIATEDTHHVELYALLELCKPNVVVCERFDNVGNVATDFVAREYIGVITLWTLLNDVELVMQTPSQGKQFWSNDKLKKAGLYKPGLPHANDALRHLLRYLTFVLKHIEYVKLLKV